MYSETEQKLLAWNFWVDKFGNKVKKVFTLYKTVSLAFLTDGCLYAHTSAKSPVMGFETRIGNVECRERSNCVLNVNEVQLVTSNLTDIEEVENNAYKGKDRSGWSILVQPEISTSQVDSEERGSCIIL